MAKLNFGYEEVRKLDIRTRDIYLNKIQELFGDKNNPNNPHPKNPFQKQQDERFPLSKRDQENLAKREAFFKGENQK